MRTDEAPDAELTFTPRRPTSVRETLAPLARGRRDRYVHIDGPRVWRATRTPDGPATQLIEERRRDIRVRAWGPGAAWLVDHAAVLLGDHGHDVPCELTFDDDRLSRAHREHPGLRFCRTEAVFDAAFPTILEQKVTGKEAVSSYLALQRRLGHPAPVPAGGPRLLLPPDPRVVADTPSHVFHAARVERKRSDTVRRVASYAHRLEDASSLTMPDAHALLEKVPGIGAWSAAEIATVALGDADAVSVGDYHLKNVVSWFFTGEPRGSDERMLELLEPYWPQRGRVIRLIALSGSSPPRYGPRMAVQQRW